nr:hypothetical protein [Oxobacter pfennigii]
MRLRLRDKNGRPLIAAALTLSISMLKSGTTRETNFGILKSLKN